MKEKANTIYFCHICSYRSNDRTNFASHMKITNHNNKCSYNCKTRNHSEIKNSEIQKKKINDIKRIVYIEEKDACDEILDKLKKLKLKN